MKLLVFTLHFWFKRSCWKNKNKNYDKYKQATKQQMKNKINWHLKGESENNKRSKIKIERE